MPPLIQFNSSSKLDSKSNRHEHQTVTQDEALNTQPWGGGGRAPRRPAGKAAEEVARDTLPAPGAPPTPLERGISPAAARLTVLSHRAFRGQTGRGLRANADSDLAGGSGPAGAAPTGVSKTKLDSRSFKKAMDPAGDQGGTEQQERGSRVP